MQDGNKLFPEPESIEKILSNGVLKVKIGHSYAAVALHEVRPDLHSERLRRDSAANLQKVTPHAKNIEISKMRNSMALSFCRTRELGICAIWSVGVCPDSTHR